MVISSASVPDVVKKTAGELVISRSLADAEAVKGPSP
jgi:hypothetical protein